MARVAREDDRARVRHNRRSDRSPGSEPGGDGAAPAPRRTRAGAEAAAPRKRGDTDGRRTRQDGDPADSGVSAEESRPTPRIAAPAAAKAALRQIVELTGKEPEGVTAVQRAAEGWAVGVEVVEDRRVPSSSDILAVYEAELDADGELMSYRRLRRYSRGRGGSDEGS